MDFDFHDASLHEVVRLGDVLGVAGALGGRVRIEVLPNVEVDAEPG